MVIFPGLVGTTWEIDQGGGGREVTRREDGLVGGKASLRLFTIVVRRPKSSSSLSPSSSSLSTRCLFTPT